MQVTMGLRRAALIRGGEVGVVAGSTAYTWRDTVQRVARLAGALQALGVGRGDRVAILSANGASYLELYYAVPWAGGIVMPINVRLSAVEVAAQLADAEAAVLAIDDPFIKMLPVLRQVGSLREIVHVGSGAAPEGTLTYESLVAGGPSVDDANVGGDETYGLFYTGGTTAAAKGVMLTHGNICANAYNHAVCFQYGSNVRYLHAAPMFHLADSSATFAVTMLGATHAFLPAFTPEAWACAVQQHAITHTLIVPTMINAIVNLPGLERYDLCSLQQIAYGGSPMSATLVPRAQAALGCALSQGYGMTETSPLLTTLPAGDHQAEGPRSHRLKSAGVPVPNAEIAVLDEEGRRVPQGTIGEICARGPMVMKGYWRKPEETAQALRGGFMHTGDVGYVDDDGYVYLVDRAKDMIVSGGENVYSVEVEAALYAHPAVLEAAVFGVPHDVLGESVHAVVVRKPSHDPSPEALAAHCRTLIAGYKCPRTITVQDEALPKSGAGKILKRELRSAHWQGSHRQIN